MLRVLRPMPIADLEVRLPSEATRASALPVPAIPSSAPVTPAAPQTIATKAPARLASPQALETELVRLENLRNKEDVIALAPTPPRHSEKRSRPAGYRPIHLSYEPAPMGVMVSCHMEKKGGAIEDVLWRALWILCLVFAAFAVIALAVKSYNLL